MSWDQAVKTLAPHIVKIETPNGWGTGFLAFWNHDRSWCGIATAAHVVKHADEWQQPIKIRCESQTPLLLQGSDRVIFLDSNTDSAVVLFLKRELQLPQIPITLVPMSEPCGIGADVGWLGYPNLEPGALCFFSGTVSHHLVARKAYLIDGVAINGVSGGPVIHVPSSDSVQIIGSVSAYHANRATGEALPGLLIAQDVSHFHGVAEHVRSVDEANAAKREFEAAQKLKAATDAVDAAGTSPPASTAEAPAETERPAARPLSGTPTDPGT
jgi:hypothetical protein